MTDPELPAPSEDVRPKKDGVCRILSLDGGGAKGFYVPAICTG